jgi:16S rRNA (uracil1498-N3)-methyltransferase
MSERFYINWPLSPGPVVLDGPEARHLATVCRLRPGDRVQLFNGDGSEYPARVEEVGKRSVALTVEAVETPARELSFQLEVAAPLPKGDRTHFLIEKLTELGVARFVPLLCERSVIEPREGKLEKLQRIVIEASKQCGRNRLMEIGEPVSWAEYAPARGDELRYLAHSSTAQSAGVDEAPAIRCVVGPEGGFSPAEIELAQSNDWRLVDLGATILRIETAAIALATRVRS